MSALRARIAALQARVDGLLDGMSPRDRKLAIVLVVFLALVAVGGGAWWMNGSLESKAKALKDLEDYQHDIDVLAAEYEVAQADLIAVEDALRQKQGQDLSTFMEKAASTAGIAESLDSVREVSVVELGSLEQKNYTVRLTKISQEQAAEFLYQVEGTGFPLRISSAKFKRVKVSGEWLLNLTLEVAAYRLLEEG